MSDEMINKSTPHNKASGVQGISETVELYNHYDMNYLNDPIKERDTDKVKPGKYNKNS